MSSSSGSRTSIAVVQQTACTHSEETLRLARRRGLEPARSTPACVRRQRPRDARARPVGPRERAADHGPSRCPTSTRTETRPASASPLRDGRRAARRRWGRAGRTGVCGLRLSHPRNRRLRGTNEHRDVLGEPRDITARAPVPSHGARTRPVALAQGEITSVRNRWFSGRSLRSGSHWAILFTPDQSDLPPRLKSVNQSSAHSPRQAIRPLRVAEVSQSFAANQSQSATSAAIACRRRSSPPERSTSIRRPAQAGRELRLPASWPDETEGRSTRRRVAAEPWKM